jgi:hypothetical protein
MNCEELRDHYELYAMGAAEEPERSEIHAHLNRKCEACMAGIRHAMEMAALLGASAPVGEPSAKLRRRILASVGVEQRRFGWTPLWAAAAVLSLLAAGYLGSRGRDYSNEANRLRRELQRETVEVARLTEAFAILAGSGTAEASFGNAQPRPPRGRVFLNPRRGVLLVASNLPPAPLGRIYEMWMLPKAGKPVPAGLFQSLEDGSAMHIRSGAVDLAATGAVAVTLEAERGADQPTTQPLIVASF